MITIVPERLAALSNLTLDIGARHRGSRHESRRSAVAIALHLARARGEETTEP